MVRLPTPALYLFSGLPGSGKSTLAQLLAKEVGATYLRLDTLEQGLRDLTGLSVVDEGYRLAHRLADDNLQTGVPVVADSCNPIDLTRRAWMEVAERRGLPYVNIEVLCSDAQEHRNRIEHRMTQVEGLRLPTWEEVLNREFTPWNSPRTVVDTAGQSIVESFKDLLRALQLS